ncbi:MAG: hypothetical protein A2143_09895 [Gallionellales bacterium RBG_16_57_15]|nr:MAG: hypothetical protein A2143_09895 [Gallionellales bacterium RBG_16_57_15]
MRRCCTGAAQHNRAPQAEKLITQNKVQALFGCRASACRKAVKTAVEKHHHLLFYPLITQER